MADLCLVRELQHADSSLRIKVWIVSSYMNMIDEHFQDKIV